MIVSQAEDILRKKFGSPALDPELLRSIRDLARSEIESKGNFYWQASSTDILIPVGVDDYDVKVDFIVPDFSEFRFLALQRGAVGSEKWRFIYPGSWQSTLEGVAVTGTGFPERATYENGVLTLSPIPNDSYAGFLYFFATTSEPTDVASTDSLYTDFPQLAIFTALAVGERLLNKSSEAAKPWEDLAEQQVEKALAYTAKLLGEPGDEISPSLAARVLQAQAGQ